MLVSRFRNSHDLYIQLRRISESKDTSHLLILVSFGFEVRLQPDINDIANFETTTLGVLSRCRGWPGAARGHGSGWNLPACAPCRGWAAHPARRHWRPSGGRPPPSG